MSGSPLADPPDSAGKTLRSSDMDRGHGRIGIREAAVCHDAGALQDLHLWSGLQAVGKVTATQETRFLLPGGKPAPERFLQTVRWRRTMKNPLHRVPDVTMGENGPRCRKDSGSGT